jgi:hypothetical protein
MKKISIIPIITLSIGNVFAVTTMQMGSGGVLTNLQNSTGQNNQALVWGLLVDTTGDGFQAGNYLPGFTITDINTRPEGVLLDTSGGISDDRLFISALTMATGGTSDGSTGLSTPTNFIISYNSEGATGVSAAGNQSVALVWFDFTTKTGQTTTDGLKYGLLNLTTTYSIATPADQLGGVLAYGSNFVGADPVRTASFTLGIPEPSSALLGAFGAIALLRRRRK